MVARSASALIAWPEGSGHRRLRAALMLQQVVPESLPWPAVLARVRAAPPAEQERIVAFVDVADGARPGPLAAADGPRARDLPALLPRREQRAGVWLSRTGGGVLSEAERAWARAQGFAGWLADTGSAAADSELEATLQAVAPRLGLPAPERGSLARADALVPAAEGPERWRRHVRTVSGQAAEAWGRELPLQLPVATRRWRLREYPDCVVGHEVTGLWARRHGLARGEAVVLGRAAVALGLMRHVAGEHDFDDAELFYELLDPAAGTAPTLDAVLAHLRGPGGVVVADRSHHGHIHPACWVGREAVDSLLGAFGGARAAARLALQRLMQLGFIEHVVHEQPLHDGHFFYRFTQPVSP
jgi:hypothetical protein